MFFKTGVLKNFTILTGKQQCWSLILRTPLAATSDHNLKKIPDMSPAVLSNFTFAIFKSGIYFRKKFKKKHYEVLKLKVAFHFWLRATRVLLLIQKMKAE